MSSPLLRSGSLLLKTASASFSLGLLTSAAFTKAKDDPKEGKDTRLSVLVHRGLCHTFPSMIIHCDGRPIAARPAVPVRDDSEARTRQESNTRSVVQQLASGSIVGLLLGLSLRIVSRALVFTAGAGIIFLQVCSPHLHPDSTSVSVLSPASARGRKSKHCWITFLIDPQWLSLHGFRIVPNEWIREKLRCSPRGIRWMFEENAPFKLSMAGTMALAAAGKLPDDE